MASSLQTTSLKLENALKERLNRLAVAQRRSAHWLMREAIEQYIEREEARQRLKEDALAAWAAYERTGQHITADEADAWLKRLEAGEDAEPPAPHD
jgi:predicted transcriptional regulator